MAATRFGSDSASAGPLILVTALAATAVGAAAWNPGLVIAGICGLIALLAPAWGAVLTLVAVAVSPIVAGTDAGRALNYAPAALTLVGWGLGLLRKGHPVRMLPRPLTVWFVVYILWTVFTAALSQHAIPGFVQAFRFALLLAITTAIWNLWSRDSYRTSLLLLAAGLSLVGILSAREIAARSLLDILVGQGLSPDRKIGLYGNSNILGVFMGHAMIILTPVLLSFRWPSMPARAAILVPLITISLAACAVSMFSTFSRGAYLYAGLGCGLLLLQHRRLRWGVVAGAILGMGGVALSQAGGLLALVLRVGSGLTYRENLWSAGWRMMLDHPWTGIGSGLRVFEYHRPEYIETFASRGLEVTQHGGAHNIFITKGAEMGVIGLLLIIAIFVLIWMRVPEGLRRYRDGDWISGVAAAGITGLSARAFFETGNTLGYGHIEDSLPFLVFALILLLPPQAPNRSSSSP